MTYVRMICQMHLLGLDVEFGLRAAFSQRLQPLATPDLQNPTGNPIPLRKRSVANSKRPTIYQAL